MGGGGTWGIKTKQSHLFANPWQSGSRLNAFFLTAVDKERLLNYSLGFKECSICCMKLTHLLMDSSTLNPKP